MDGLHLTDVEALEEFSRLFSGSCNRLHVSVADIRTAMSDAQSWLQSSKEEVGRRVTEALSWVEECEAELDNCLSQEDEDYIPDCSPEEFALEDARETYEMWRSRYSRVEELIEGFYNQKQFLTSSLNSFGSLLGDRQSRGERYLKDQVRRMEELLNEKGHRP